MSFCVKCGSQIPEGERVCNVCGESLPLPEVVLSKEEPGKNSGTPPEPPNQDQKQKVPKTPIKPHSPTPGSQPDVQNISNLMKVFLTAVTVVVPLLGPVIGIIMSLIYLSSPNFDSRDYGKSLLIVTVVYIGIGVVCCMGFMFLSMAGYVSDMEYYYQQQFDIY